jgi:tetratricopeptide (TPR) repeat protein
MAGVLKAQGKYEEALEYYTKDLGITQKQRGQRDPAVAVTLGNMAGVYKDLERLDEALEMYHRALDIEIEALGRSHPAVALTCNNTAVVYDKQVILCFP